MLTATVPAIKDACRRTGADVHRALGSCEAERIDRAGEAAWANFDGVWQNTSTPAQKARVAATYGHGSDGHGGDQHGGLDDMDHSGH